MGANWFITYSRGKNVKQAYDIAVDDANYEHGHQDGYSGQINCSAGFRDVTKEFKASGKSMPEFMSEQMDKLSKHQGAQAICIEQPIANENKVKTQVINNVTPGTKKWVLKYVVRSIDGVVSKHDTKGDAVKAARIHTEKYLSPTTVHMEKTLEKGTTEVAKIVYKRSSTERDGKWVFFGWASY